MFTKGMYYISDDEGCISGPFVSYAEAYDNCYFDDIILLALPDKAQKEKIYTKIEITLDFEKNLCIVSGRDVTLDGISYKVGSNKLNPKHLSDCNNLIKECYMLCQDTVIVGTPPIKGEYLNDLL